MKNDVFSPGDTPTPSQDVNLVCLFNAPKQSIKVVIILLRASYTCCLKEMVNDSPWCLKFSQFSYIGKLSGIVGGPGGGGSIRGFGVVGSAWTASPLLCCHPLRSSDLLAHICYTLVPVNQIHIHYHKVL